MRRIQSVHTEWPQARVAGVTQLKLMRLTTMHWQIMNYWRFCLDFFMNCAYLLKRNCGVSSWIWSKCSEGFYKWTIFRSHVKVNLIVSHDNHIESLEMTLNPL